MWEWRKVASEIPLPLGSLQGKCRSRLFSQSLWAGGCRCSSGPAQEDAPVDFVCKIHLLPSVGSLHPEASYTMFCIENQKLPRHSLLSAPGLKIASQTTRVEVLRSGFLEVTGRISTESPSPCSSERLGLLRAVHVCLTTNKVISQRGSLFRLRRVGLWLTFWWEGLRAGPFIRKCALLRGLSVR